MTSPSRTNLRGWISRLSLGLAMAVLLFIKPMCHCPRYYIYLSAAGLIPLLCGPRFYRWFGGGFIALALLFAFGEHRAALQQAERVEQIRAQAESAAP